METKIYPCRYPKEIYDCLTDTKTLSVNAEFFPASVKTPVSDPKKVAKPYYIYGEPFSRLVVTIISTENGVRVPHSANIPVNDIAGLFEDARAARQADILLNTKQMRQTNSLIAMAIEKVRGNAVALQGMFHYMKHGVLPPKNAGSENSPGGANKEELLKKASAVRMSMGKDMKGKTPYEFLSEGNTDADALKKQAEQLSRQKSYLSENLDKEEFKKYKEGNQKQIDAISAALEYYKKGYFNAEGGQPKAPVSAASSSEELILLKGEPKPNKYKKDAKTGLCPVYEISIKYIMGYRSPIQITILNYEAPVATKDTGALNVVQSQIQNKTAAQFNLSWKEFANFMRRVEAHMRRFEQLYAKKQIEEALNADAENRREAAEAAKQAEAGTKNYQPPQAQVQQDYPPQTQPQAQHQKQPPRTQAQQIQQNHQAQQAPQPPYQAQPADGYSAGAPAYQEDYPPYNQ